MKIINFTLLALLIVGCSTEPYTCQEDQKTISKIDQAFILFYPDAGNMSIAHKKHDVIRLKEYSSNNNTSIEIVADLYRTSLYCSFECAEAAKEKENVIVDSLIVNQLEQNRIDSLVLDSIIRGLIK